MKVDKIKEIWKQTKYPVLYRKGRGNPLLIKIPYAENNRAFFTKARKRKPEWNKDGKYWSLPYSRLNELVNDILHKYGSLYIIQPYIEREVCAPLCATARGFECSCSCMGANHGAGSLSGKWYTVSDTFAVKYKDSGLACRLLQLRK